MEIWTTRIFQSSQIQGLPFLNLTQSYPPTPESSQYISVSLDTQPALFVAPWVTDEFFLTFFFFFLIQDLNPHIAIDYQIF